MDKASFTEQLREASLCARDFAARHVVNSLPESARYLVHLNRSCDENPLRPGEHVFPDDVARHGACVGPLAAAEVVALLCRDNRVPEWIDISVCRTDTEHTYFELLCCGRFTADPALLYYREGHAPFGIKSPIFPPRWKEADGKFDLRMRRGDRSHPPPPVNSAESVSPLRTRGFRSAGERAFDRCLFPFVLHFIQALLLAAATGGSRSGGAYSFPQFVIWVMFGFDLLLCLHWAWAARSVIAAWRDPYAKVLRFSSLGLLLLYTPIIVGILRLPFE